MWTNVQRDWATVAVTLIVLTLLEVILADAMKVLLEMAIPIATVSTGQQTYNFFSTPHNTKMFYTLKQQIGLSNKNYFLKVTA